MNWGVVQNALFDELQKIGEASKKTLADRADKVVEYGVPALGGAGVGKTLMDLSLSKDYGPSPRRKTLGALLGAAGGIAHHHYQKKRRARKKAARAAAATKTAASPFTFTGTTTKRFLSKPGKTIKDLSPKIGRMGVMPV